MTDRKTLDQLTSDELDQLYDRVAKAEEEADTSVAAAAHLTTLVGKRSERAERRAKEQRRRADIFETELRVLRAGLRANGADPTQIQNLWAQIRLRNRQWREEKQRAERAEATITRVHALADRWKRNGTSDLARYADIMLGELDAPEPVSGPAATQATDDQEQPRV